ncbi:MAG TPA: LysM peptidoglycan-binding domain-containing protein [Candidatus Acidoferrales bacterium]|nr:LysM peptidoglycan-binding domain-containing protein [Candidatus Acidoferrales bacterium]
MRRSPTIRAILLAGALYLGGCNDTAKKPVQAHPPVAAPEPVPAFVREPLPLPRSPRASATLAVDSRPAIDILVAKVQAAYDAGKSEYKAGDLEKAQADFDRAGDLILASGFEVDSDPRLSKLSDEIGEAGESSELNAPENTADVDESDTPAEPAPIDEIADLTLPAGDPRLAIKAEKELISVNHDLPLAVNESVLQYLSFFTTTRGRAIVSRGLERAGRYNDMIRRVLKEEGVPQDLIYLAQAESAFQPEAVSRAGARGIWQFMPYRGEEYDLERNYWVDERSDPEKATRAAARHLRDLYAMFGDWYLVMAAYNSGPLNVARAIQRTGYADFWELQKRRALPKQTQNYVPIILALAFVAKDPASYGVQVDPEKPPQAETINLEHSISLNLVADATGADIDDLRLLNPELVRNITPNQPGFQLKLPAGTAKSFEANIQQVPQDKWTSWRLHASEQGETLSDIARHYRVTLASLEAANHLEPHASVPAGFLLDVPTAPPVVRLVHYRVQRGDSLEGIAGRFDVTVAQLKRWNHLSGSRAPRGARLRIYAGTESAASPPAKAKSAQNSGLGLQNVSSKSPGKSANVEHRVKPGETLYSIAREYQTTISALRHSNPFLTDRELQAGDVLTIPR